MQQLLIEPRDTLLFRDAREFGQNSGNAKSLAFPLPSVVAGAVRTRLGSAKGGTFDPSQLDQLLEVSVLSPFLVSLNDQGQLDWFFPAPSDAVVFQGDVVVPLLPVEPPAQALSDFSELPLVLSFAKERKEKPAANAPRFWSFDQLKKWLIDPQEFVGSPGISGPSRESRIHIKVGKQATAEDKHLFATEMLRFSGGPDNKLSQSTRLGIAALVDKSDLKLNGLFPIGGERRLAHWKTQPSSAPECPKEVRESIRKHKRARLILATPAYFESGHWRPQVLGEGVVLEAAAVRGYATASGWDLKAQKPKPSRRLAPAGSVYYVRLPDTWGVAEIDLWIHGHWLKALSDDTQSRRDGFGVALVGTWHQPVCKL